MMDLHFTSKYIEHEARPGDHGSKLQLPEMLPSFVAQRKYNRQARNDE